MCLAVEKNEAEFSRIKQEGLGAKRHSTVFPMNLPSAWTDRTDSNISRYIIVDGQQTCVFRLSGARWDSEKLNGLVSRAFFTYTPWSTVPNGLGKL